MPKLLFLSRLAFICNLCFLLTIAIRAGLIPHDNIFSNILVVMGTICSFILNLMVTLILLIWLIIYKRRPEHPLWLIIVNFLFFVFQLIEFIA